MSDPTMEQFQEERKDRGEQLRALVVSWAENKTFLLVLNEQQRAIEDGEFSLNEDWCIRADEILGSFMAAPKMTAWDEDEKKDDGPRIIIP